VKENSLNFCTMEMDGNHDTSRSY